MPLFPVVARPDEQRDTEMSLDSVATPKMDSHAQRIRIKNRRKRYLDLHPEYFKSPELELAGRRFVTVSDLGRTTDF